MDAHHKRRSSFSKSKLIPFYRASKLSSTSTMYKDAIPPSRSATSVFYTAPSYQDCSVSPAKQEQVAPDLCTATKSGSNIHGGSRAKSSPFDKMVGPGGDENVDAKAAKYISAVQERFKLERVLVEDIK